MFGRNGLRGTRTDRVFLVLLVSMPIVLIGFIVWVIVFQGHGQKPLPAIPSVVELASTKIFLGGTNDQVEIRPGDMLRFTKKRKGDLSVPNWEGNYKVEKIIEILEANESSAEFRLEPISPTAGDSLVLRSSDMYNITISSYLTVTQPADAPK